MAASGRSPVVPRSPVVAASKWLSELVEEIVPECAPHRPVVTASNHAGRIRRQGARQKPLRVGKTILAPEAEVHARRARRAQALHEAPDASVIVILGQRAGLPGGKAGMRGDLRCDDATAQIRRQQAQAVDALVSFGSKA